MDLLKPRPGHPYPRVGISVLVLREGKLLFGLRKGAHGADSWAAPGGKLELGESWEACARREAHEETGVEIKNIRFLTATNDIFEAEKLHYITVFMLCDWAANEPRVLEPTKCVQWGWFSYDKLPEPYFLTTTNLKKIYPNRLPTA